MMASISCKVARRLLPGWIEGSIGTDEADLVEHIGRCAACAGELRSLRALLAATTELSGRDVPDPGEAYWDAFVPSVRARISRRGAGGLRRSGLLLARVAAAGILMVGAATGVLLVSRAGSRQDPAAARPPAPFSVDDAGRRMDEALGRASEVSIELTADLIGIDPLPEIGASDILEAMKEIDRPLSLSGVWVDLEGDELQRLLDGLDVSQTRTLRAELAAERG